MGLRQLKTKFCGARRPFNLHNCKQISLTTLIITSDKRGTVEHHLSGIIGTTSHLDMHNIRIIGFFFFEHRLHWQFEVGKSFYRRLF